MSEIQKIIKDSKYIGVKDDNTISFKLQEGPIKEKGVNGCQIDDVILTAKKIIESFALRFPCRENSLAITKLDEALHWLHARKIDRIKRDVEGKDLK